MNINIQNYKQTNLNMLKFVPLFITLFSSLILFHNQSFAQESFCLTEGGAKINPKTLKKGNSNTKYYIKIYMHVIRTDQGTGGQPVSRVNTAFSILEDDFDEFDIYFVWDGCIDYIDNTTYASSPEGDPSVFSVNAHNDGVDVYLFPDDNPNNPPVKGAGQANGIVSTAFYVSGNYRNSPYDAYVPSSVVSHEMGHCLGLFHPYYDGECEEFVDGSNCDSCGDLICDTAADVGARLDSTDINCEYFGSTPDHNGDIYQPDNDNIMAVAPPSCLVRFTPGQGQRMRDMIASESVLQATLTYPPTFSGTVTDSEGPDPLVSFNPISSSWADTDISFPQATSYTWTLTSGSAAYTTSTSGDEMYINFLADGQSASFSVTANGLCGSTVPSSTYAFARNGNYYRAYPNPTPGITTIEAMDMIGIVDMSSGEPIVRQISPVISSVQVINQSGNILFERRVENMMKLVEVDLTRVNVGTYLLKIHDDVHDISFDLPITKI
jgi:hypothetical protein